MSFSGDIEESELTLNIHITFIKTPFITIISKSNVTTFIVNFKILYDENSEKKNIFYYNHTQIHFHTIHRELQK